MAASMSVGDFLATTVPADDSGRLAFINTRLAEEDGGKALLEECDTHAEGLAANRGCQCPREERPRLGGVSAAAPHARGVDPLRLVRASRVLPARPRARGGRALEPHVERHLH